MQIIKDVYAQVDFSDPTINPTAKFSSISMFINIVIPLVLIVGGLVTLSMLLLGAFRYITSAGNPEKISKAQSVMLYAVLGLFLMVLSYVFTKIIGTMLHIQMPL